MSEGDSEWIYVVKWVNQQRCVDALWPWWFLTEPWSVVEFLEKRESLDIDVFHLHPQVQIRKTSVCYV